MSRQLLRLPFLLSTGLALVAFAFAINLFTGGSLPQGMEWYEPWNVPVLGVSAVLMVASHIWANQGVGSERAALSRRTLSRSELRRYKDALVQYCSRVRLPFRLDPAPRSEEIYVPLRAVDEQEGGGQVDASTAIGQHRTVLILGPPGSGKSMLLKQTALSRLTVRSTAALRRQLPILLELKQLREPGMQLWRQLAAEVGRLAGIEHPEQMLDRALKAGNALLLLDGLDEVNASSRAQVAEEIRRLMDMYRRCKIIVTCRSAVFDEGLRNDVERVYHIAELNDHLMLRFLRSWKGIPEGGADRLMAVLRTAPKIMELARNPLLLTLLAYLYAEDVAAGDRGLPGSRSEFYREATDVLLHRWRQGQARFMRPQKRAVLERLALWEQDRLAAEADRTGMDFQSAISQIADVLPLVNLERSQAKAMLEELVEHSGLLLDLGGGERYQFAHLTVQEYFAAGALRDDLDGLLRRYQQSKVVWREPLLLWCGEARDATRLIERVHQIDPVMALECLDSAQMVDPELSERIIAEFRERLVASDDASTVALAFGTIAAGESVRARAALDFLTAALDGRTAKDARAVASALAATRLPEAAEILGARCLDRSEARAALVQMGDIAVPVLSRLAAEGSVVALDSLQAVGTPAAAEALTSLLWAGEPPGDQGGPDGQGDQGGQGSELACQAAWRLAVLLKNPSVEVALAGYPLTPAQRDAPHLAWLWQPFTTHGGKASQSSLRVIAGRVGYLLWQGDLGLAPATPPPIDPRISVALVTVNNVRRADYHTYCSLRLHDGDHERLNDLRQRMNVRHTAAFSDGEPVSFWRFQFLFSGRALSAPQHTADDARLIDHTMRHFLTEERRAYLFATLPQELRLELGIRMLSAESWVRPPHWSRRLRTARESSRSAGIVDAVGLAILWLVTIVSLVILAFAVWDLVQSAWAHWLHGERTVRGLAAWIKVLIGVGGLVVLLGSVIALVLVLAARDSGSSDVLSGTVMVGGFLLLVALGLEQVQDWTRSWWVAAGVVVGIFVLIGIALSLTDAPGRRPIRLWAFPFEPGRRPALPQEAPAPHLVDHPVGHHALPEQHYTSPAQAAVAT